MTMYSINGTSGVLTTLGTVMARPGARAIDMSGGTAAVTYTPKFAYAANNGSNNVSAFSVTPSSAALTTVSGSPYAAGTSPTAIAADPAGKFVYVANIGSTNVSTYASDPASPPSTSGPRSPFSPSI